MENENAEEGFTSPHTEHRKYWPSDEIRIALLSKSVGTKLAGGLDAMAISATHIAFLNLSLQSDDRTGVHKTSNIVDLCRRITMVELEYDGITLTAIDAGMSRQMIGDDTAIARTIDSRVRLGLTGRWSEILSIVLSAVLTTAGAAIGPVPPFLCVLDRELDQRFCDMAPGAQSDNETT